MAGSRVNDDGTNSTIPTREAHDAFRKAVAARRNYRQSIGGPFEQDAHQALQDAVAYYFEVLRPLLCSSNATDQLWNDEKLWPTEPVYQEVAICSECGNYVLADKMGDDCVVVGDLCPNCARDGDRVEKPRLEPKKIPATNEDGEVLYRYVEGLESVDGIFDQRVEQTVEYSDALGKHTKTVADTQLIAPQHLKTIARKLDEALRALNLHVKEDDKLPTGGVTTNHE